MKSIIGAIVMSIVEAVWKIFRSEKAQKEHDVAIVDADRAKANADAASLKQKTDDIAIQGRNKTPEDLKREFDDGTF